MKCWTESANVKKYCPKTYTLLPLQYDESQHKIRHVVIANKNIEGRASPLVELSFSHTHGKKDRQKDIAPKLVLTWKRLSARYRDSRSTFLV
ncbi:hypothetical protein AVEN_26720-1 [Araneus ventricosus]|uniref:Uncharacterized protein n=1 Tax=Araneus ventricosus TaxID=182803 RepID=A0A4Y2WQF7_ARAVE|nr:hypothetical protein AVEN_85266-1 [Araneus ventricosus]GBO39697.1 hypothetical protein AVEN_26720-1 [Araneus ventricosus]